MRYSVGMTNHLNGSGSQMEKLAKRRRRLYAWTVGFLLCVFIAHMILLSTGNSPLAKDAPDWLHYGFLALVYLPLVNLVVANMFFQGERDNAVAADSDSERSGPAPDAFTVGSSAKLALRPNGYVIIPIMVLAGLILAAVTLGPVAGDALISSGASLAAFNVFCGAVAVLVAVALIWAVKRGIDDAKRFRAFKTGFYKSLQIRGYEWGNSGTDVAGVDYTADSPMVLKDMRRGVKSRWTVRWEGDVAYLTPLVENGQKV